MVTQTSWRGNLSNKIIYLFLALAIVGFADSAYLTAEHLSGDLPSCSVIHGCGEVLTSKYATVGSVPVAAFGASYYVLVIVLMVAFLDTGRRLAIHAAAWLTTGGFLASLYFVYIQAFVLRAFCQYCLLSALTSVGLFVLGIIIMRRD